MCRTERNSVLLAYASSTHPYCVTSRGRASCAAIKDALMEERRPTAALGNRWLRVLVYYAVAMGLAATSRFVWHTNDVLPGWPSLAAMHLHLLSGIGPFAGALLVWAVFRVARRKSPGGSYPALGWAMAMVPAVTMGLIGVANPYVINSHLFGFYLGLWIILYTVLEETGWRGYLQDEFGDVGRPLRYMIVGLFWYPWHFTFFQGHGLGTEALILGLLVAASIGIGLIADRTGSILAAAAFHTVANVLGLTAYFAVFIPSASERWMIVGICLAVWVVMLRVWRVRTAGRMLPSG